MVAKGADKRKSNSSLNDSYLSACFAACELLCRGQHSAALLCVRQSSFGFWKKKLSLCAVKGASSLTESLAIDSHQYMIIAHLLVGHEGLVT